MSDNLQPLVQVPLDRVTQAVYAKIYSTMAPVRRELSESRAITEQWATVFGEFRDGLPSLDLSAYVELQREVAVLADLFSRAVRVPIAEATRALALQIISHDLPRVAAIATKLNEEEAPKFFAAIAQEEPEVALKQFQTADARAKTRIRKADLDHALTTIVNNRVSEAILLMRRDLMQFFEDNGIGGMDFEVAADRTPTHVFRRAGRVWKVIFEGCPEFHISNTLGARYLDWLLHNPGEVITAFDLELKITPEKESVRVKDSFQRDLDPDAVRSYLREIDRLRALREKAKEKGNMAEVERLDGDIGAFDTEINKKGRVKDAGERARGNVGKAIAAVKAGLAKGEKYEKAFAEHLTRLVSTGYTLIYNQPKGKIWE